MDKAYKSFPITAVKALDDERGELEAIVSVFNLVDLGNEVVRPGAFTASLERKLPKGVWMHDWSQPVAKTIEARELLPTDPLLPESIRQLGGLYIKGQFNLGTQRGREAYSDVKFGTVDEFSIGYMPVRTKLDDDTGVRELLELDLAEWSPVLVGMNPATSVMSVKALLGDGLPTSEALATVVDAVEGIVERLKARQDLRAKEGRVLSAATRGRLQALLTAMDAVQDARKDIEALLADSEPKVSDKEALMLRTEYLALRAHARKSSIGA